MNTGKISYTLGELKQLIREAANEYAPKLGSSVQQDEKTINKAAMKDVADKLKEYTKDMVTNKQEVQPKVDDNKTMLDLRYDLEPSKEFKEKVKSQVGGQITTIAGKNKIEKSDDTEKNEEIFDSIKTANKKSEETLLKTKTSGLTARTLPPSDFKTNTVFEEKNVKRLVFKKTQFISESHVLTLIPEEYKVNGNKFYMKDCKGNDYLMEWKTNDNESEAIVISHTNQEVINEELAKIKHLFNYKSSDSVKNSTVQTRLQENDKLWVMIDKVRGLQK